MTAFDTRDVKPKLYNIAILSAVAAAVVGLLAWGGFERNAVAIGVVLALYLLAALVMLVAAFFRQLQYNPYSYNTIYYLGFSLFLLSVLIAHTVLAVRLARQPEPSDAMQALSALLHSAKNYMLLSSPFILVFSLALCTANIALIRHEGLRPVNVLGILLSLLLLAGEAFLFRFDYYVSGSWRQIWVHELYGNLFAAVYLYFECMLIGAIAADVIAARHVPKPDKDFVIILGCGLRRDGTPTPLLQGRIERALAFSEAQKAATGKELLFVTSGGRGSDEVSSESAAMKRYLLARGIPERQIIEEDRSTNTLENMKFSREKIRAIDPEGKVAFATSNYHVFRSGVCARYMKLQADGMGARTKWYFWPNATVREFFCLLVGHRGKQVLVLAGMIAAYALLTLLIY